MPGSNSSRSNSSRDRFRLRPAQLLPSGPQTERLHIIPSTRGSCRHFSSEEHAIVPRETDDDRRLLQRQLECQRRRVEDMAEVLRYSREEREKLKNEIVMVNGNLDDSHTLLDEQVAVQERLMNELTICRRDLHHLCLGIIDIGCNIPQVNKGRGDGGNLILLEKAKKELSRMSGALQRTPISHPAIVMGEVLEEIVKKLLSSAVKEWRGFIRANNDIKNITIKR